MDPTFADQVRIVSSRETEAEGLAGLEGQVRGLTTPSVTGIKPIGSCVHDHAVNVFVPKLEKSVWLVPELVEVTDHAPGTTVRIGAKVLVRAEDGGWKETSSATAHGGALSTVWADLLRRVFRWFK